jgi:fatty acid synthase subunit alpha
MVSSFIPLAPTLANYSDLVTFSTAPHTEVNSKGDIVYTEVVHESVRKLEAYVEEMASGDTIPSNVNIQKVQDDVLKLWNVVKSQPEISQEQKNRIKALYEGVVRSLRKGPAEIRPRTAIRARRSSSQFLRPQVPSLPFRGRPGPTIAFEAQGRNHLGVQQQPHHVYLDVLKEIATSGTSFKDKNALLTGVGRGSIGVEILKGLLSGGANVVITTPVIVGQLSSTTRAYQQLGSCGSALTVVPFNQISRQDVEAFTDYIYLTLSIDLDYILPFAAIPENGRETDGLDNKSELAHRVMLVNLL